MIRLWITWQRVSDWTMDQALHRPSMLRQRKEDRGEILQTVVITGLLVAAAIIIVGIIIAKARQTAENIKTQ